MKKLLLLMGIAMIAVTSFWSCSDNDDGAILKGSLQMYGAEYLISHGILWECGNNTITSKDEYNYIDTYTNENGEEVSDVIVGYEANDKYTQTGNFILSLYEEGLVYNSQLNEMNGEGACISFHLASSSLDELTPGTYTISDSREAFTCRAFASSLYATKNSNKIATMSEGEIVISNEGNHYNIRYNCKATFKSSIAGDYSGNLQIANTTRRDVVSYDELPIAGLQDMVSTKLYQDDILVSETQSLDNENDAAFFACNTGKLTSAVPAEKKEVDIAAYFDAATNSVVLKSPISMISYLGHTKDYLFPVHTKYMRAPATFGDADFDSIDIRYLNFKVTDEVVSFSLDNFKNGYVFFESGNGIKGVLKVRGYIDAFDKKVELDKTIYLSTFMSPKLILSVKCMVNYNDCYIR